MSALAAWGAAFFLNALWQTVLVFCAAWLAARVLRPLGAQALQRLWTVALLLEVALPFCRLQPAVWLHRMLALLQHSDAGAVTVQITTVGVVSAVRPWLSPTMQSALAVVCLLLVTGALLRIGRNLWSTHMLLRQSEPMTLPEESAELLAEFAERLSVDLSRLEIARVEALHGPVTLGLLRHTLLLPNHFLVQEPPANAREEFAAMLAHELEHVRRRDFAWNLLYELIALPVAWHPLVRLTRMRMEEARELAVDGSAAALLADRATYARSLVRIAARLVGHAPARSIQAIGIYDSNIFERRIMNLMHKAERVSWTRRMASVAVCATLALAATYTATALQARISPATDESKTAAPTVQNGAAQLSPGQVSSYLISRVAPVYPPNAKAAGVAGTVRLAAMIGTDGHMQKLRVLDGPAILAGSAMDAVRQWVYKPYLLNGQAVPVETEIQVIYTLAAKEEKTAAEPEPKETGVTAPRLIHEAEAVYPPEARSSHTEGVVLVKAKIDTAGHTTVLGVEGPEVFWAAAKNAVEQYRFEPASRDGNPVETTLKIEVSFRYY